MAAAKAAKKGAPQRTLTQMAREAAAKPTGAVGAYRPAKMPVCDEDEDAWGEGEDAWRLPADSAVSGHPSDGADGPVKLSDSGGSAGQPADSSGSGEMLPAATGDGGDSGGDPEQCGDSGGEQCGDSDISDGEHDAEGGDDGEPDNSEMEEETAVQVRVKARAIWPCNTKNCSDFSLGKVVFQKILPQDRPGGVA